jgi:DNA polymerase-4
MNAASWPEGGQRVIMHIDMDAFFAAVEERFLPILKDQPVIVGGGPDRRGVASTANYAARRFGVHSATPLREAARLCPDAHFISSSEGAYGFYSARLFEIFSRFAPKVEPTSVDEAFAEITGMERHFATPVDLAVALKQAVHAETGLTCSVGIAPNKLLAKMASSHYKPDGLYCIDPDRIVDWLAPQPVGHLWGVGARTEEALGNIGVRTIGDLQQLPVSALTRRFGKWGDVMHRMAHGVDNTPVLAADERPREKSIGHEHTFDDDTDDPVLWHATLLALCDRVGRRLRQAELYGRTVTLKFRTADFRTTTHADSLSEPTNSEQVIFGLACRLLEDLRPAGRKVRLLGVSVSKLSDTRQTEQIDLFAPRAQAVARQGEVSDVVDRIRDRFGSDAIGRLGAQRRDLRRS